MFNSLRIHTLIALILLSGRELNLLWSPRNYTKTPGNTLANLYDKSNQYVYVVAQHSNTITVLIQHVLDSQRLFDFS